MTYVEPDAGRSDLESTAPATSLWTRWCLRACTVVGRGVIARGRVVVRGGGTILIDDGVTLDGRDAPIELCAHDGAFLLVGAGCAIAGGASLEATARIELRPRVKVGAFVKVLDNAFHPLAGDRHARPPSEPVFIGEDVALNARAIVLPGAFLGAGCVVGPATVVAHRIPPRAVVAGMPARLAATAAPERAA